MEVMRFSLKGWKEKNYWLGWCAISVYAFFWLIDLDISRIGESLFILCFVVAWFAEPDKRLKWHRIFLLLLAFLFLQVGVYFFAAERFPDFANEQVKSSRHVAKLFLCVAIAWWLRGSIKAAKYLLIITCLGFICSLFLNANLAAWVTGFQGKRVDFGYVNAQHTSVYFGMLFILGLTWLLYTLVENQSAMQKISSLGLVMLSSIGIVITQTRAVWLAVILTLLFALFLVVIHTVKKKRIDIYQRKFQAISLATVLVIILGALLFKPIVSERIDDERKVIVLALAGELDKVSYSSIGNRIHTWSYALDKIAERPLTGWGPQSRKPLIDEGPFPGWVKERYGHFHNSYLEIALAYGLMGVVLLSLLTFYIMRGVFSLSGSGYHYFYIGLLSSFIFFAVVNVFESYLIFRTGIYFYAIIGGVGMSFYLFEVSREKEVTQ